MPAHLPLIFSLLSAAAGIFYDQHQPLPSRDPNPHSPRECSVPRHKGPYFSFLLDFAFGIHIPYDQSLLADHFLLSWLDIGFFLHPLVHPIMDKSGKEKKTKIGRKGRPEGKNGKEYEPQMGRAITMSMGSTEVSYLLRAFVLFPIPNIPNVSHPYPCLQGSYPPENRSW
jgi:hypothetical protein